MMRDIHTTPLTKSRSFCCTRAMQNCHWHCPEMALVWPKFQRYQGTWLPTSESGPHLLALWRPSIGSWILVSSQGPTSSLLSVVHPWPMPATKTSAPTCSARLLEGTGGFLPSRAPTVPTRRTRASRQGGSWGPVECLGRGCWRESRRDVRQWYGCCAMKWSLISAASCKLAAVIRCYIACHMAALHHTFRMLHCMLHSSAISLWHLPPVM